MCTFTLSLLLYLPTKKSDVGVKACQIRKVEKQPADLPLWLKTQQVTCLFTHPQIKRKPQTQVMALTIHVFFLSKLLVSLGPISVS